MRLFPWLAITSDGHASHFTASRLLTDFYFALQVRKTQAAIKHALTERFYAWEDARKLAQQDPEVDLSGVGPAYTPEGAHLESEEAAWEDIDEQSTAGGRSEAAKETRSSKEAIDPSTIPNGAKAHENAHRV